MSYTADEQDRIDALMAARRELWFAKAHLSKSKNAIDEMLIAPTFPGDVTLTLTESLRTVRKSLASINRQLRSIQAEIREITGETLEEKLNFKL